MEDTGGVLNLIKITDLSLIFDSYSHEYFISSSADYSGLCYIHIKWVAQHIQDISKLSIGYNDILF